MTDPTGVYGLAYDNMGRLVGTSTQYAFIAGQTFTNSYAYDAASNRTSFTSPHGGMDTYAYDTVSQLTSSPIQPPGNSPSDTMRSGGGRL